MFKREILKIYLVDENMGKSLVVFCSGFKCKIVKMKKMCIIDINEIHLSSMEKNLIVMKKKFELNHIAQAIIFQ